MQTLNTDSVRGLLTGHEPPCISLYQPRNRRPPDSQQDPVQFRNLVREVEKSLGQKFPRHESRALLEPFHKLAEDARFWEEPHDGLAVLGAPGQFHVFPLERSVPEMVVVAESFHVKPLLRVVQSADRYQVLCVSRRHVKFYEGNREGLHQVALESIPERVPDIQRGEEETTRTKAVGSFANELGAPFTPEGDAAMYQGHGYKYTDVAADAERFFRAVDREILDRHSRPSGLPLVLACLPESQSHFRGVSHNPFLVPVGIEIDPFVLSADGLRERAWRVMEPEYEKRLARLVELFGEGRSHDRGSGDPAAIGEAAVAGRVATLLVEADRVIPGRIDPLTGHVDLADPARPDPDDDVLDDLAELVLKMGGQVVVVPADRMPTQSGAAAIYRF